MFNNRFLRAAQHQIGGEHVVWAEPTARRLRVYFGGALVADSNRAVVLFNGPRVPVYYFPRSDVRLHLMVESHTRELDQRLGERSHASLVVGSHRAEDGLFFYREPIAEGPDLSDYVSFVWDEMDAWFEEDDQIYRHARDPYKRVDALRSSRHVRVLDENTVIADSHRPTIVFETGLSVRYYLPKMDVRMDLLTPTSTRSRCPYKGEAVYWNLDIEGRHFEDIVWSYPSPIPEITKIENLLAFYQEKIDIEVDGHPVQ